MTLVKLETGGLVCPFPLIDAKKKMAELAVGDELLKMCIRDRSYLSCSMAWFWDLLLFV